ncbi:trypsin-like cysteine/serine peptidase domain-containing protein [Kickxella alabastrina]|uniref:trypsin-like cysteine/serine peptidase domain-containing protein n=1 Tax=Kickxella alabastrina TaxID=61397 RepID=UPI00221FCFE5|nr:trypsin-like cysteine/serine peptidase domain-containing protein [Kickxella alabastrina]KAI7826258.1 trypsin-like cysteine/serine peptidase domain-containing protein [Kickxella alabastrina]
MYHRITTACAIVFAGAVVASASGFQGSGNSTSGLSRRIVGGGIVDITDHKYIVYSVINGCTGVLIAPNFVLTAQSCVDAVPDANTDYSNMKIQIGNYIYPVSKAYSSMNFPPMGYYNHIALLELSKAVPSKVATPIVGFPTLSTMDSTVTLDELQDKNYCKDANSHYNADTEICSRVSSNLNTCRADFGAPVLTPVKLSGSSSSSSNNENSFETTYALLGLTTYSYKSATANMKCVYGGTMGFYTWLYPFAEQIAALANMDTTTSEKSSSSTSNEEEIAGLDDEKENNVIQGFPELSEYHFAVRKADSGYLALVTFIVAAVGFAL